MGTDGTDEKKSFVIVLVLLLVIEFWVAAFFSITSTSQSTIRKKLFQSVPSVTIRGFKNSPPAVAAAA